MQIEFIKGKSEHQLHDLVSVALSPMFCLPNGDTDAAHAMGPQDPVELDISMAVEGAGWQKETHQSLYAYRLATEPTLPQFSDKREARRIVVKIRDSDAIGQRLGGRFALTL